MDIPLYHTLGIGGTGGIGPGGTGSGGTGGTGFGPGDGLLPVETIY